MARQTEGNRESIGKELHENGERVLIPVIVWIASQSVKTTGKAILMWKKVKGRKQQIVTDTQGHLLPIQVPAANLHDTMAGCGVFEKTIKKYRALKGVCADSRVPENQDPFGRRKPLRRPLRSLSALLQAGLARRWIN